MIYIIIIFLFLGLSYVYDYRGKEQNRLFWWIVMLVLLICVAGFRYQMGEDSIRYEKYYADTHTWSQLKMSDFTNTRYAPFFVLFNSLCRTITPEFMLLQLLEAMVVNTVFFMFIWKHTRHIFLCGLLYFFFLFIMLNMQVLREAFAVSIFLLSWPFFVSGKWLKYYLCCIAAFLFHISSVVLFLLPIIFVPGIRELFVFGKRTLIILPAIIILSFSINYFFFDFIKLIAITESIAERASTYSKDELGGNTLNIMGSVGQFIRFILYPLVAMYFLRLKSRAPHRKSKDVPAMERMALVAIYVAAMSLGVAILIRYIHYFDIFALIQVSKWVYGSIKINGRYMVLNFAYWMFILFPLFFTQYYMEYNAKANQSGTIRNIDMYWPYSNQIEREISTSRKKAIEHSQRYF